jgi:branched-chain amino acid transport system permease protein
LPTALILIVVFAAIAAFPYLARSPYFIHIGTLIFIWSFITTSWSYMGRFGLVSLGHGAFLGLGAYTSGLLFNFYGLSPWMGMLLGGLAAVSLAMVIGYGCFRFGVIGDYFALVTLALGEVVALTIIAFRDITGGSLGFTLKSKGTSFLYLQSEQKIHFYYLSLGFLILALLVWKWIDRSRMQKALRAIGEDEIAASTLGIGIIRYKMMITMISAFMTAVGAVLYAQYITYLNPHTLSGVAPSLEIAFKAILGGMFSLWGPTVGTALIVSLEEYFRVAYGSTFVGLSQIIYGLALVLLII